MGHEPDKDIIISQLLEDKMGKKLFKYAGSEIITKAFSTDGLCSLKCSYPKDFNDPYELFLTIDFNQRPEILAYYNEVIGEIPQLATTCFSKAPDIIPMWAHYANNHEGVIIEIDEEKLSHCFPDINFGDVEYRNKPDEDILGLLFHAHMTRKPRHTYFLQKAVFTTAYFSKNTCWKYEYERRVVAQPKDVIEIGNLILLQIPVECITALMTGHKATTETKTRIKDLAKQLNCSYLEMQIGRSTLQPYFVSSDDNVYTFVKNELVENLNHCNACKEPTVAETRLCPWCSIEKSHTEDAVYKNPMRLLSEAGRLEDYYRTMESIGKNFNK